MSFYDWLLARNADFSAQSDYAVQHKDDFPKEPKSREELLTYLKAKRDCALDVGRGFVDALGLYMSGRPTPRGSKLDLSFDFSGAPDDDEKPPR
jgi:hypothetical protein